MNPSRQTQSKKGIAMAMLLTFISLALIIISAGFLWVTNHAKLFDSYQRRIVSSSSADAAAGLALADIQNNGTFNGNPQPWLALSNTYVVSGLPVAITITAENIDVVSDYTLEATYTPPGGSLRTVAVDFEYYESPALVRFLQITDWQE